MNKFELKHLRNQMEYVKEMSEYLALCNDPKEVMDRMADILFISKIVIANVKQIEERNERTEKKSKRA